MKLFKASEQEALKLAGGNKPSTIGDDYVVYVDNVTNPSAVTGYRNGDVWYNAQGEELQGPTTLITSNGSTAPLIVEEQRTKTNSTDMAESAFEDYQPQISVMPRIAFSFPISDEALFFAHYDILTKRPTDGNRLDLLDYYYLQQMGSSFLNNPNLKPEQTIDYEVGFQQTLGKSSSLKISAFYRELRNLVQVQTMTGAYPDKYLTYSNRDFGTVKGFTLAYDLRRTKNISIRASYTLQFADGTGSDAGSQAGLARAGKPNLKTVNALNYDQRHRIVANLDYRFASGKDYNGPTWKIFGKDRQVLAGTGLNMVFNMGSGVPYNAQSNITGAGFIDPVGTPRQEGSINGARYPAQFTMDARIVWYA